MFSLSLTYLVATELQWMIILLYTEEMALG